MPIRPRRQASWQWHKSEKALYTKGAAFMNVIAPCPRGWQYNTPDSMDLNKLAVETCYWPLYEVENGKYTVNYNERGH